MSHLPLLFAEGHPSSLETFTQPQLERFIPFMVQCCPSSKTCVPSWWPKELPFSFPLKPTSPLQKNWLLTLKNIVRLCYQHYDCVYVLNFCRKLVSLGDRGLYYRENGDRVDIMERLTDRLLVSVKSKNKTYDSELASPRSDAILPSPRKLLLKPFPSTPQQVIDDIYLCSFCDAEFTCCRDACDHEKTVHAPPVEEQSSPQERHFKSLGLLPASRAKLSEERSAPKARRITSNLNLKKLSSIPICTPLGRLLTANTPALTTFELRKAQEKMEQYCATGDVFTGTTGIRRSRRVPGSIPAKLKHVWSHQYSFNREQRADRMETIRTGLDKKSRRLLRQCRPAKTTIRRLPGLPGKSTINLRRLKDFIAEEFPNQTILEPPKLAQPPPPPPPPTRMFISVFPQMYTNLSRRPLAGVPSNRLPTNIIANRNPVKIQKALPTPRVTATPQPAQQKEPEIIDLCSSDEECEVVAIPDNTYLSLVNTPKYGVTASSPKQNCLKVDKTEMAGIPAKDNHTVLFVSQFSRSRS